MYTTAFLLRRPTSMHEYVCCFARLPFFWRLTQCPRISRHISTIQILRDWRSRSCMTTKSRFGEFRSNSRSCQLATKTAMIDTANLPQKLSQCLQKMITPQFYELSTLWTLSALWRRLLHRCNLLPPKVASDIKATTPLSNDDSNHQWLNLQARRLSYPSTVNMVDIWHLFIGTRSSSEFSTNLLITWAILGPQV